LGFRATARVTVRVRVRVEVSGPERQSAPYGLASSRWRLSSAGKKLLFWPQPPRTSMRPPSLDATVREWQRRGVGGTPWLGSGSGSGLRLGLGSGLGIGFGFGFGFGFGLGLGTLTLTLTSAAMSARPSPVRRLMDQASFSSTGLPLRTLSPPKMIICGCAGSCSSSAQPWWLRLETPPPSRIRLHLTWLAAPLPSSSLHTLQSDRWPCPAAYPPKRKSWFSAGE